MTENTPPVDTRKRDAWRIIPGVVISLFALAILFCLVDWREFLKALQGANYSFLVLSLPIYLISYFARAQAWQVVLLKEPPLRKVFLTQQAGYLLNNVFPLRVGELGRAYLLGRTGLGFWRVFSTIFVERAFDMLLAVGLLLGTLPFVVAIAGARQMAVIVGLVVLLGLVVMYLLARKQAQVLRLFEKVMAHWPRLVALGRERLQSFLTGLTALASPSRFLAAFSWMGVSWVLAILVQYLVLKAYVPDAQILWAAFALGVAALGVAIPSSPGQIGVYESAFVYALTFFDVSPSSALAYALTTHVMYYIVTAIFGAYALAQEGESLGQLFRQLRDQRTKETVPLGESDG